MEKEKKQKRIASNLFSKHAKHEVSNYVDLSSFEEGLRWPTKCRKSYSSKYVSSFQNHF